MVTFTSKILGVCNHRMFLIKWFNDMERRLCFVCLKEKVVMIRDHFKITTLMESCRVSHEQTTVFTIRVFHKNTEHFLEDKQTCKP